MSQRFFDQKTVLPELDHVTQHFDVILKELKNVSKGWQPWPEKLWDETLGHEWKVIPLYAFGKWANQYCAMFPETQKVLSSIPTLRTALFSRLGPKTVLKAHTGWDRLANVVLRCHLGLVVPSKGQSGVWVNGKNQMQQVGKWIVFDDSLLHTGFNMSESEDRIVLIVDVERPPQIPPGTAVGGYTEEVIKLIQDTIGI